MKKLLSIAAASAMVLPAPVFAQDARDPYGNNAGADEMVAACRDFADNDIGLKRVRGLCGAYYRAEDPVVLCITIRDMGALGEFGFSTQGDCIAAFSDE